jgi:hypothetical protein
MLIDSANAEEEEAPPPLGLWWSHYIIKGIYCYVMTNHKWELQYSTCFAF